MSSVFVEPVGSDAIVSMKLLWLARHFNVFTSHNSLRVLVDQSEQFFTGCNLEQAVERAYSELYFEEGGNLVEGVTWDE